MLNEDQLAEQQAAAYRIAVELRAIADKIDGGRFTTGVGIFDSLGAFERISKLFGVDWSRSDYAKALTLAAKPTGGE